MQTLGLLEYVLIRRESDGKWKRFKAKLDTGAGDHRRWRDGDGDMDLCNPGR